jgi:hypothetical protein
MKSDNLDMDDLSKELQDLHNAVGDRIHETCYFKTLEIVEDLGSPELVDGSVPLEAWMGMAQAMADASGYRVVLEASLMKEMDDNPDLFQTVGYVEIAAAQPTLFCKLANSTKVE